jgi:HAD superfamily hydrolase (TIGR01509 family)
MKRAVIFDMDGVIINSEDIWRDILQQFFTAHGGTYTHEMRARMMGASTNEWTSFIKETLRLGDTWTQERILQETYARGVSLYATQLQLMPGFLDLVKRIRANGIKTGLASGSSIAMITEVFDRFELYDYFDVIVSSDSVEHAKPAPDVYLETANQLRCAPEECTGIEDSPNGVRSVKAAGMKCIALPDSWVGEHPAFREADLVRPNLAQVSLEDVMT